MMMMAVLSATVATVTTMSAMTFMPVAILTRRTALEFFILLLDAGEKVFTKLLGSVDHCRIRTTGRMLVPTTHGQTRMWADVRYVQIHLLVALAVSRSLKVARSTALNLHSAVRLLLDVLHVGTTVSHDLRTQVEARNRLKIDGDLGVGPLSSAKLISLHLFLVTASESSFVYKVRKLLLHELFDLVNSLLEAGLGGARNVEVERGVLWDVSASRVS